MRLIRYAFAESPALQANGALSEAGGIEAATVEITNPLEAAATRSELNFGVGRECG